MKTRSSFVHIRPRLSGLFVVLLAFVLAQATARVQADTVSLIPTNSFWKYLDTGADPGVTWRAAAFDDSVWPTGPGPLGYGEPFLHTTLNLGSGTNRLLTAYFRRLFIVPDAGAITNLITRLLRDDGAVAYLNNVEVFRHNLPTGPVNYWTLATTSVGGADETTYFTNAIPAHLLVNGVNVMAVEVHQNSAVSADLTFDLELIGYPGAPTTNWPPTVAVPRISSFSPAGGPTGTVVTIAGANFSPNPSSNVVYFGAVKATVLSASTASLAVRVPVGATYAPISVTVGGLTAWAPKPFGVTFNGGGVLDATALAPRIDLPAGDAPVHVVVADLDGDGQPDLAAVSSLDSQLSVYRNLGSAGSLGLDSFAPRVSFAVGASPYGLAAVDLDGDGRLDLVTANLSDGTVSVLRNQSAPGALTTASFAARVDFPVGRNPVAVAAQDLDGDGRPEIVTANQVDHTASVLRNLATPGPLDASSFAPKVDFAAGDLPHSVAIGDWDGDGWPELFIGNHNEHTVCVFHNRAAAGGIASNSFAPAVSVNASGKTVALGDWDGDGKLDLVSGSWRNHSLSFVRNVSVPGTLATNSFAPAVELPSGGYTHTVALGDLDGDGKPDLAAVTEMPSALRLYRNRSTPGRLTADSIGSPAEVSAGWNAVGVAVGDLDADGRPDIVFANHYDDTLVVYRNQISSATNPPPTLVLAGSAWKYVDTGANLGAAWRQPGYDDSGWPTGLGKFGFGEGNEITLLNRSATNGPQVVTYYFRRHFVVPNPAAVTNLALNLLRDDGAVVYLNGREVRRDNLPALDITYATPASLVAEGAEETSFLPGLVPASLLVPGTNLLAVEVHQYSGASEDLGFDLALGPDIPPLPLAEALDTTNLVWTTGGDVPWFGQTNVTYDRADAAQSGHLPSGMTSWIATTVDGPGTLSFRFRVRTEETNATFKVLVDDAVAHTFSLHLEWSGDGHPVPAGRHTVKWRLENPETGSRSAVAWLDQVSYAAPPAPPVITRQPASQTVTMGQAATFNVEASGTSPLSYRWRKNGVPLATATEATLVLSNVQSNDAGSYTVVVTNVAGLTLSSNATLTVLPPPSVIAARELQENPAVATDGTNFLVVWMDRRNKVSSWTEFDLYGARVTPGGQVLDPSGIAICTNAAWQQDPALAFDGTNYLVVWSETSGNEWSIRGARVSREGRVLDPDGITICDWPGLQSGPHVAFNHGLFLVTWNEWRNYAAQPLYASDIYAARVSQAGVVLDPRGFPVVEAPHHQWDAQVTPLGSEFLVVWHDNSNLRGAQVARDGVVSAPFTVATNHTSGPTGHGLSSLGALGWLTWDEIRVQPDNSFFTDVYGARLGTNGQPHFTRLLATNVGYPNYIASAAANFGFWAVYETSAGATNSDVRGLFTPAGSSSGMPFPIAVSTMAGRQDQPAIACNGWGCLVAWRDGRQMRNEYADEDVDIYGTFITATGQVVHPSGFLISSQTRSVPMLTWPTPADIVYGTPLSGAQLNATADVPGTFVYSPPAGTILNAGQDQNLYVTFTPQDTARYESVTNGASLDVQRAPLTITADNQTRYFGQPNPPLTATYAGLVAGEEPGDLDAPVILLTSATADSLPGLYPISVIAGGDLNYTITRVDGTLTVLPAPPRPGALDPSFRFRFIDTAEVLASAWDPQGRLVIGGTFRTIEGAPHNRVARLVTDDAAARVDVMFDADPALQSWVRTLAVQADGKVLVGCDLVRNASFTNFGVARLNADGSLDAAFRPPLSPGSYVPAIAVEPSGRILLGGSLGWQGNAPTFQVVRLLANGAIGDTSFAAQLNGVPLALLPTPDGKLLIGGDFTAVNNLPRPHIARLNRDGTVDTTFNPGTGTDGSVFCLARQPDGRILLGGEFGSINGFACGSVARLHADGSVDSSFHASVSPFAEINALVLQPDGKLVIGGEADDVGGDLFPPGVARLNPDGSTDATFDPGTGIGGDEREIYTLALQPDGRIILGGQFESYDGVAYGGLVRIFGGRAPAPVIRLWNVDCGAGIRETEKRGFAAVGQTSNDFWNFYTRDADDSQYNWRTFGVLSNLLDAARQPSGVILSVSNAPGAWGFPVPDPMYADYLYPFDGGSVTLTVDRLPPGEYQFLCYGHGPADNANSDYELLVDGVSLGTRATRLGPGWDSVVWQEGVQYVVFREVQILSAHQRVTLVVHPGADGYAVIAGLQIAATRLDPVGPDSFVERRLPAGRAGLVQLVATPSATVSVYAIEDQPPAHWFVTNISHGGVFDARTGRVKFGPFFDAEPRTLSYLVLPPPGTQGAFVFTGQASADGVSLPIGGAQFCVIAGLHPADLNLDDSHLAIGEVTAYGASWRRGTPWPYAPNPIPIDYVTRAGFLWRNGECYEVDPTVTHAPQWWVPCVSRAGVSPTLPKSLEVSPVATAAASRQSTAFVPGEPVTITIAATPAGATAAYAVADQFPSGWAIANISTSGQVKWGPFFDNTPRTLSYQATPPLSASGQASFAGMASFDGASVPVSGPRQLRASCRVHTLRPLGAGHFRLSFAGGSDAHWLIETSSDLTSWLPLNAVAQGADWIEFTDPDQAQHPQRFYRARLAPE